MSVRTRLPTLLSCVRLGPFVSKRSLSIFPEVIKPSAEEVEAGQLSDRNLEKAVRHVHQDGLVVVENAIPLEDVDALNAKMTQDALYLQSKGEDGPFNYNLGNLQQDAPPVAEYFYPSVFTTTQITAGVLGPRPRWTFCSANAAMPPRPGAAPQRQPVHSDADMAHPRHPFALVVNVPLVTMTPDNGATELYLRTHTAGVEAQEGAHGERASRRIRPALLRQHQQSDTLGGPVQPVVRDLRLWHGGMPNHAQQLADDIRPVLADLDRRGRLGLQVPVDWVSRAHALASYLDRGFGNSYDFDQTP